MLRNSVCCGQLIIPFMLRIGKFIFVSICYGLWDRNWSTKWQAATALYELPVMVQETLRAPSTYSSVSCRYPTQTEKPKSNAPEKNGLFDLDIGINVDNLRVDLQIDRGCVLCIAVQGLHPVHFHQFIAVSVPAVYPVAFLWNISVLWEAASNRILIKRAEQMPTNIVSTLISGQL